MHKKELIQMYASLPVKLSELSKVNPEAAIEILQDWGAGRKSIRKLWGATSTL
ncbi:hypothetical protein JTI58_10875 [Lysinibacillus fusiformis]|uniref:hypothetical protein n=1 Tax=Lysinibacillus fusiformis TaxID=28031 RepID=UPI00196826C2|nr:hypothetical protein [Lysinibacillus fusiformis]QSB12068.1 hypothetical protein JTI58_10875 [Lysinibacillus fusiformis]